MVYFEALIPLIEQKNLKEYGKKTRFFVLENMNLAQLPVCGTA
jgi:hypothetical protein